MLPIKLTSIFKSRWMALLWSAGILWAAADFVGDSSSENGNEASSAKNDDRTAQQIVANAFAP